jgi:hypothetical protein
MTGLHVVEEPADPAKKANPGLAARVEWLENDGFEKTET